MFVVVYYVRETVKKSCRYGEYGSFEHVLFLLYMSKLNSRASHSEHPCILHALEAGKDALECLRGRPRTHLNPNERVLGCIN